MKKYRNKKPMILEADIYKHGMEDFWGCSLGECIEKEIDNCNKCKYKAPFIIDSYGDEWEMFNGDYVVKDQNNRKTIIRKEKFEKEYELMEE